MDEKMKFKLNNVRLSFPHLITPKVNNQGVASFNCSFLLDPQSDQWKNLQTSVGELAKLTWGDKSEGIMKKLSTKDNGLFYGDGEKVFDKQGNVYSGYEGMKYVRAGNKVGGREILQIIDHLAKQHPVGSSEYQRLAEQLYAGCYVNAIISIWAHKASIKNSMNDGIRATLLAIQFNAEGERFGTSSEPVDFSAEFAPIKKDLPFLKD